MNKGSTVTGTNKTNIILQEYLARVEAPLVTVASESPEHPRSPLSTMDDINEDKSAVTTCEVINLVEAPQLEQFPSPNQLNHASSQTEENDLLNTKFSWDDQARGTTTVADQTSPHGAISNTPLSCFPSAGHDSFRTCSMCLAEIKEPEFRTAVGLTTAQPIHTLCKSCSMGWM